MIFCFSGPGNSRYIAERLAEALQDSMINLNSKIKTHLVTTEKLNAVTEMIRSASIIISISITIMICSCK